MSSSLAREVVRVFDFSLSALPSLAKPPRGKKGESALDAAQRFASEWRESDPLKQPLRAAFNRLTLSLIESSDATLLPEVLSIKTMMNGTLHHVSVDPASHQYEVLRVLHDKLFKKKNPNGDGAVIASPSIAAELFGDVALMQLALIAAAEANGSSEDKDKDDNDDENIAAVALAYTILLNLMTDAQYGTCSGGRSSTNAAFFDGINLMNNRKSVQASAAMHKNHASLMALVSSCHSSLTQGQRRILRLIHRLKPSESSHHGDLILACIQRDDALAAAFMLSLPYYLEPEVSHRWVVHAGIAGSLLTRMELLGRNTGVGFVEHATRFVYTALFACFNYISSHCFAALERITYRQPSSQTKVL